MIDRLRPPPAGRLEIADSNCPGLVLRVTDQGTKTLAVIFKVPGEGGVSTNGRLMAGRQHRITLGRWPGVGLKEAREKARTYLSDVTEGRNPKAVLVAQNLIRHTTTVSAMVERFIAQECKGTVRSWAPFGSMYRLLMLTGQRRAEWAKARRSEVDTTNRWLEVPRGRYKGARDHVVPLSGPAWAVFDALPVWTGKDSYLLSSRGGKAPVSGFTQGKRRLEELATKALAMPSRGCRRPTTSTTIWTRSDRRWKRMRGI